MHVAIDVGQTGIRARIDGRRAVEIASGGVGGAPPAVVAATVHQLLAPSLQDTQNQPLKVGIGLTGEYAPHDRASLADHLSRELKVSEARITHDSTTALLGAAGVSPAVVTMCGTGALSIANDGTTIRRYDALGPLGDWGGGASLGLAGIRAALRSWEGIGTPSALAATLADSWQSPMDLFVRWRRGVEEARTYVNSFAHVVAMCADAGDELADSLIVEAARSAADTTLAAARQFSLTKISYGGAMLLRVSRFREVWSTAVRAGLPNAQVITPAGDGLDGSRALLRLDEDQMRRFDVTLWSGDVA